MPLILLLSLIACKKNPDFIGVDLLPEGDYLHMSYLDTSTIIAYTIMEDAMLTDELSTNQLGYLSDPIFGNVLASIYTQYRLPNNNVSFGTNAVPDSIILTLAYSGIYGDSASQHRVRVYEMDDTISVGSKYYSYSTIAVKDQLIGDKTFVPQLVPVYDSVAKVYSVPQMRIPLTLGFANSIMSAGEEALSSNSYFQNIFKGIYITTDPIATTSTGAILYLDLLHEASCITIYYHNDADSSKSLKFLINSSCARFNNFNHFEYAGADPEFLQQTTGDTTMSYNRLYLEAMGGTKIKVKIPYLAGILDKEKIAVNEALLIITNDNPESVFAPPSHISMKALTKTGETTFLKDETIGTNYFGGRYLNKKEYSFRITKYVQDRMQFPETEDYGMVISVTGASVLSNRVVLKGPADAQNRMKLVIYYTIIE